MNINFKRFLLVPVFASFSLLAMDGQEQPFRLRDHALPHNSIRAKLDQIFQEDDNVKNLTHDKSWTDFHSWHWLVGKLTTLAGKTEFITKAALIPPYVEFQHPESPNKIIHASTQNISRIPNALRVQRILQANQITGFKIPQIWVYPLSGNDADLDNPNITDQDVVIIEEMLDLNKDPKAPTVFGPVNPHVTKLTPTQWKNLVTLAENGVLDLHGQNLEVDTDGNIALIDLENLLLSRAEKLQRSNPILKPLRKYKHRQLERGSALSMVAFTGLVNEDSKIQMEGFKLLFSGVAITTVKKNAFEIAFTTAAIAAPITALIINNVVTKKEVNKVIDMCSSEIDKAIKNQNLDTNNLTSCLEVSKTTLNRVLPNENREDVFKAFATIVYAEHKTTALKKGAKVKIFDKTYNSYADAIKKSSEYIQKTWKSDRSISAKIKQSFNKMGANIKNLFSKKQEAATA